jgi:hypothetical protein
MSAPLVQLRGISKSFREGERERLVFRDASLLIAPGEWVFPRGEGTLSDRPSAVQHLAGATGQEAEHLASAADAAWEVAIHEVLY